jgi:hypothetical protein
MSDYTSSESDWATYAFSDLSRGYTRNLVDEGNGKSNLVRTCPFQYSQVGTDREVVSTCMDAWKAVQSMTMRMLIV